MASTSGYYDLLEAMARPGCPICALVLRDGQKFLDALLYEYVLTQETHRAVREGRGLCNHHSWQMVHHHGNSLGVSVLFDAALDEMVSIVETTSEESAVAGWARRLSRFSNSVVASALANKLEPQRSCLICENVVQAEGRYLTTFADHWTDGGFVAAFRVSDGLCLPHVRLVLPQIEPGEGRQMLATIQVEKWKALKRELDAFQRKSAFNYVGEPVGAEADSWKRAVAQVAGTEDAPIYLTRPD